MGHTGLEPDPLTSGKDNNLRAFGNESGAESGAVPPAIASTAPELALVTDAWPNLPATLKARILGMIEAAQAMADGADGESGR